MDYSDMVNKAAHPVEINHVARYDRLYEGPTRTTSCIRWPRELHDQIEAEAKLRGWSFSAMVRHLCEASIEGIE